MTGPPTGCLRTFKTFFNTCDQAKEFVIDARDRIQSDDREQAETVDQRKAARVAELAAICKSLRPRLAALPDLDACFNRLNDAFGGLLRKAPLPVDDFDTLLQTIPALGLPPAVVPGPAAPIDEASALTTVLPYATAADDLGPPAVIDPSSSAGRFQLRVRLHRSTRMKLDAVIRNDPSTEESAKPLDAVIDRVMKSDPPDLELAAQTVRHATSLLPKSGAAVCRSSGTRRGESPHRAISGRLSDVPSKLGKLRDKITLERECSARCCRADRKGERRAIPRREPGLQPEHGHRRDNTRSETETGGVSSTIWSL